MEMPSAKRLIVYAALCLLLPLGILLLPRSQPQPATVPDKAAPTVVPSVTRPLPGSHSPWTLAEARAALKRQPDDCYLQYVVLQLARQEDRLAEVRDDIALFHATPATTRDLFGVLTDAATVQQQLQRDLMLGELGSETPNGVRPPVSLDRLQSPAMADRRWPEMLDGKQPAISTLARCVPADFYLAEFRTLDRLASVLEAGRAWLAFLAVQINHDATTGSLPRRLEEQLVFSVEDKALLPLTDRVAITGSDPFLAEGSDVTLLVQVRPATLEAFATRVDLGLRDAAGRPGAGSTRGKHRGIDFQYVATADRRMNVYAATLASPAVHVRSNSRQAFFRVLDAALDPSVSLGATAEFQYIRTLLPLGDNNEDGLVYAPDALRRRLLSPPQRIIEARRRIGANHLQMIAHAAQLHRTQFGKAPRSLDDLSRTGCAPGEFNKGRLASPLGGTYSLSADGVSGVCSVLGTTNNLTPCSELNVESATAGEADGYQRFVSQLGNCDSLWLAPVALRLQGGSRYVRAEAVAVTPPSSTAHAALLRSLGPSAEPLEPLPVPRRNIASVNLRLNKEQWLREHGAALPPGQLATVTQLGAILTLALPSPFPMRLPWSAPVLAAAQPRLYPRHTPLAELEDLGIDPGHFRTLVERGVGNQAGLHVYDAAVPFDLSLLSAVAEAATDVLGGDAGGKRAAAYEHGLLAALLVYPAYVAIPVKDAAVVDEFLTRLDAGLARQVPTWRADRFGIGAQGQFYRLTTRAGLPIRSIGLRAGPVRLRLFWARIGDGLYIANQPGILDDLQTATTQQVRSIATDRGPVAQAMVRLRPANWALALPGMRLGWEEANREACQRNLALLSAAARAFSFTPPVTAAALDQESRERLVRKYAAQMHGFDCACPDGGRYSLTADGKGFTCSVHGSPDHPRQPDRPAGNRAERLGDATVTLTITPDTLRLVLTVTQQ